MSAATKSPAERRARRRRRKPLLLRHLRLHLWLALDAAALLAYFLCRGNRAWMNTLTERVTGPYQRAVGRLCARTPVSVMEILFAALIVLAVVYLAWCLVSVLADRGRRLDRAYANLLTAVCAAGTLAALSCLTWGANFWADGFQDKSGLYARPVSQTDLLAVTEYFAQKVAETVDGPVRDGNGRFAVPRSEILEKAPEIYGGVEELYPFLAFDDTGVKAMTFSRVMSFLDFTGFYCSFTGEANVNTDSPACLLPSTAAHEMAHQRGIASEQECNFLAVLACTASGDPAYAYSGYLCGFIYLGNALYQSDPDAYWAIREALPEAARTDMEENNAYWRQFRDTVVQKASNTVYDGILKGYGDERGMRSYGAMVDLLVAYWGDEARAAVETVPEPDAGDAAGEGVPETADSLPAADGESA